MLLHRSKEHCLVVTWTVKDRINRPVCLTRTTLFRITLFSTHAQGLDNCAVRTESPDSRNYPNLSSSNRGPKNLTTSEMESDSPLSSVVAGALRHPACECATGKECRLRATQDSMFKDHFRGPMVSLMHRIIEAACDDNNDCTRDTKRVKKLKKEMDDIRGLVGSWTDVTPMFINGKEPVGVILRKVLDVMHESCEEFEVSELLCMCTFVTDLCVSLLSKNLKTDADEIVESVVSYALEKNLIACRDFLFLLDHL